MTSADINSVLRAESDFAAALSPEAISVARQLDSCQRAELRRLRDGRHCGDPLEVAGLRTLGLQDDELGLTPLGVQVADLLDCSWRIREPLGLTWRRS